jgi:hypothetical protein
MLPREHNAAQATRYSSHFAILRLYAIAVAQSGGLAHIAETAAQVEGKRYDHTSQPA